MRILRFLPLLLLAFALPGAHAETSEPLNKSFREVRANERFANLIKKMADAMKAHDYEKALAITEEALQIRPDDPEAQNCRAAALIELGRYDEARELLTRLTEENPKQFPAAYNLGEIMFLQGDYETASRYFATLVGRFGSLPVLKYKVFLATLLSGKTELAQHLLKNFRFPADGEAWYFAHAAMALKEGNRSEARRLMAAAESIHSDEVDSYKDALIDAKLLN